MFNSNDKNKHELFRNQIRKKHIERICKQKRQVFMRSNAQSEYLSESNLHVYQKVLEQPEKLFIVKNQYLLMLRQALNSQYITINSPQLYHILEILIRFYTQQYQISNYIVLFMQCLACIFYCIDIQPIYVQKLVQICIYQMNKQHNQQQCLRNRCLITLENISSTENHQVQLILVQTEVLEQLSQMLEDFPINNQDKLHILSIYGNLLETLINKQQKVLKRQYNFQILRQCFSENYDPAILSKSMEIILFLFQFSAIQLNLLINISEDFINTVSYSKIYVQNMEKLCTKLLSRLQTIDYTIDQKYLQRIQQQIVFIDYSFNGDYDFYNLLAANIQLMIYNQNHFEQLVVGVKNLQICQAIIDNWIERENDCSLIQQESLLQFLYNCIQNNSTLYEIISQHNDGMNRKNTSNFSILDALFQFLSRIDLNTPQKKNHFIRIMCSEKLNQYSTNYHRQIFIQKIQECLYDQAQNQIKLAKNALDLQQYLKNQA